MKLTHKEYLEHVLHSKEIELKELEVKHRIEIAEYDIKKKMLREQLDSIERQLSNGVENIINAQ